MRSSPARILLVAAALMFHTACAAFADDAPRLRDCAPLRDFAPRWKDAMESFGVPGFAVAVVKDGRVILLDAFGVRDPRSGAVATPDTMYYIASCTKTYVAVLCAALAEDGRLNLDAPVKAALPSLQLPGESLTGSLTTRDLLCHRHGIQNFEIVFHDAFAGTITDELYFRLLPGSRVAGRTAYSNVHFTLAGHVVEALCRKSWRDVLAERILEPTGMSRTTAYASRMYADENVAWPTVEQDGKIVVSPAVKSDRTMHAAGGMGTTARDAARWLLLHLNEGSLDGKQVLSRETMRDVLRRHSDLPQPEGRIRRLEGFGLGWQLGTYRGRPYATHGGGYIGAAAHLSFLTQEKTGVVVLVNAGRGGAGLCDIVSIDIYDRLLGLKEADLLPTYKEEARAARTQSADAGQPNPTAGAFLSLSHAAYVGAYENDRLGKLELTLEAGQLVGRIGDLKVSFYATAPDRFEAEIMPGERTEGEFGVDGGRVAFVRVNMQGGRAVRFERK